MAEQVDGGRFKRYATVSHSSFRGRCGCNPQRNPESALVVKQPAIYILTNRPNGVLYVGVTSDLIKRVWQHRNDAVEGFSQRYQLHLLVHFERHQSMIEAIEREKELKKWRREWKVALVEKANPEWRDLWPDLIS